MHRQVLIQIYCTVENFFFSAKIMSVFGVALAKITELKKNAEVKAENVKLKHALEEHEARFMSLEQRDEEKATLIAKLDDDIKEIKQSSASTSSVENSDIPICTETKLKPVAR